MTQETGLQNRDDARAFLERMAPQMKSVLPRMIPPERLIQVTMMALSKNPALYQCTARSLAIAVMECATLGLVPDGVAGHAYLIPFKREAKLVPGYRGLVTLARRTGVVLSGRPVFERDEFSYRYGMDEDLVHVPYRGEDRGPLSAAYAVARQEGMPTMFLVLESHEIAAIKSRSMGARRKDSPWNHADDVRWMWTKSAIRALAKFLDLSGPMTRAVELMDASETGVDDGAPIVDIDIPDDVAPEPNDAPADDLDKLAETIGNNPTIEQPQSIPTLADECVGCGTAMDEDDGSCSECGMAREEVMTK